MIIPFFSFFNSPLTCSFFYMMIVGSLADAVDLETGCVMRYVVVETTGTGRNMRLHPARLTQLQQATQAGCSTAHYQRKSLKTMNFQWFSMLFIDFH